MSPLTRSHVTTRKPRVLDLFCGGGGAAKGYLDAGFSVEGWDIKHRQSLPDGLSFFKGDVRHVLTNMDYLRTFDLIHASPPCQSHSRTKHLRDAQGGNLKEHGEDMVDEVRQALLASGVPFVLENVPGAPLRQDLLLCGSSFPELSVIRDGERRWLQRHRIFEVEGWDVDAYQPRCIHAAAGSRPLGVYGSKGDNIPKGGQTARTLEEGRALMGIDWMSWAALVESIPPAYTRWIGLSFLLEQGEVAA